MWLSGAEKSLPPAPTHPFAACLATLPHAYVMHESRARTIGARHNN